MSGGKVIGGIFFEKEKKRKIDLYIFSNCTTDLSSLRIERGSYVLNMHACIHTFLILLLRDLERECCQNFEAVGMYTLHKHTHSHAKTVSSSL